jgi:hypothetical protein
VIFASSRQPFALNYFTGSKEHNIEMRNRVKAQLTQRIPLAPVPMEPESRKKKRARRSRVVKS